MIRYLRALKVLVLIGISYFRRKFRFFLATFFVILVFIFTFIMLAPSLRNTVSVSEGIIGTYQEHDLPETVTRLLSHGLVEMDKSGKAIPKLVDGWEVNNDATVFTFKLKKDLSWTDGTEVKSSNLEFAIEDVEVSYPSDMIIQFKLKDSFSPFPSLLTKPIFKKGEKLVGIGDYELANCHFLLVFPRKCIFKSRIFITKIILEPRKENLPKVILRFYPSEKIAQTAFSIGEIQAILGITEYSKNKGAPIFAQKQKQIYSKVISVLYNTTDPLLSNRYFRQALGYSIPKIAGEEEAESPIPPNSWVYNSELEEDLKDLESAKTALARAKQTTNPESLQKEIILTSTPQYEGIGRQIVSAWQSLELKAVLRVESGIPQNFQALLIAQSLPTDPDQYALWHSTQKKSNLTRYSSARIDKDLEDGRKTIKENERRIKYLDFQKILMEDHPATFLYFPKYNYTYLKKIEENLNKILPLQLPN